jgi:AraC family transcriptional regulator
MMNWSVQAPVPSRPPAAHELTRPLLYLSSTRAGWDDLLVQAYYEPSALEGWQEPVTSAISLVLFTGGSLQIEQRQARGSWRGITLHHGEFVLNAGRNQPAEVRWTGSSAVPTQTLHLQMSRELVLRTAEAVTGTSSERLRLVSRAGFQDPLLTQIALTLRQELEQPAPAGKLYAQAVAQFLAVHLVRQYSASKVSSSPLVPGGLTTRQIRQVRTFIQDQLSADLSLEKVAQQVGFSPYHFARLFRRTMGVTLHQFVVRQRLERAQWLLQQTDLPLAQVASACGFTDQSHFTLVFNQQMGCTPGVYRRQEGRGKGNCRERARFPK